MLASNSNRRFLHLYSDTCSALPPLAGDAVEGDGPSVAGPSLAACVFVVGVVIATAALRVLREHWALKRQGQQEQQQMAGGEERRRQQQHTAKPSSGGQEELLQSQVGAP